MRQKLSEVAERHNFTVESYEVAHHGVIVRGVGVRKLEAMRSELLESGHKKPISCHREDGSAEAFMILWHY